ncbi:MAG: THUMP-like domain-containing protein, partial [Flavobacterium sp.]
IKEIHLVAIQNEVKEFLILIEKGFSSSPLITAVNLQESSNDVFTFDWNTEKSIRLQNFSPPKSYLYEPNAAIMKSGGFSTLGNLFPVTKLHKNSHLFTSDETIDFPGRSFKIIECMPYQKSSMREFLKNKKANISVRNFPEDVKTLKSKWKIADGGDHYLFFTTDVENNKIVLLCEKM